MATPPYRILIVSTAVGPLGSGLGGGVELILKNIAQGLRQRHHQLTVVAPEGSVFAPCDRLISMTGAFQPTAHTSHRDDPIVLPKSSVLAAMWDYAHEVQQDYDVILHFCYDWLPFYLAPFFQTPVAHFVSMGSLTDAMDAIIGDVAQAHPGTVGVFTQVQADTFPHPTCYRPLGSSLDLSLYEYCETPEKGLAWMGRISPEKGLEDAIAAAQQTQIPLQVLGKLENPDYWQHLQTTYPDAPFTYLGFLPTQALQAAIRTCQALLMTPKWVEAFGLVAIEALACGVPVVAYRRGGPVEILKNGITGWLVEPDSISGLVQAIERLDRLDRRACRQQAETHYSLAALAIRYEQWLGAVIAAHQQ